MNDELVGNWKVRPALMPVIIQHLLQRSEESGYMFLTGRNSIHEAAVSMSVRPLCRSVKIKLVVFIKIDHLLRSGLLGYDTVSLG